MSLPKKDKFINEVLSHVKFTFDRPSIKSELEDHLHDKINDYMEEGMDIDTAEQVAIEDMGDAEVIGVELNKQHNPTIGWIWRVSSIAVKIVATITIFLTLYWLFPTIFESYPGANISKDNIVYDIKVNERVRIDDRVITVTRLIYDNKSNMHIFYNYYETKFWRMGWSLSSLGEISDNLGNTYLSGSGAGGGGSFSKVRRTISNFSPKAETLIINYNRYNRQFRIEIPLPVGDSHE